MNIYNIISKSSKLSDLTQSEYWNDLSSCEKEAIIKRFTKNNKNRGLDSFKFDIVEKTSNGEVEITGSLIWTIDGGSHVITNNK
jgi:hypothetical protein